MNHIPPIFEAQTFRDFVSKTGKSIKEVLTQLENARSIADLHNHILIRRTEHLPSKNQIEHFKPSFEVPIVEIINKLK